MSNLFNSSSKTHSVTKTQVPQNYQDYLSSILSTASSINNPFQAYTDPRIADLSANEQLGINSANSQFGQYQPLINLANQTTANNLGHTVPNQGDLDQFMNPYTNDVLNNTLARLNEQYQTNQVGINSKAGMSGAFGGTRQGVMEGANLAELLHSTGDISSKTYADAFDKAMGNFYTSQNLSRGLTGDLINGANAGFKYNQGDIQGLMDTGLTDRTQRQAGLDFNYSEFLRGDQDSSQNALTMAQIAQMYPRDIFTKTQDSKTTNTPSVMSDIAGVAAIGAGIMGGPIGLGLNAGQMALGAGNLAKGLPGGGNKKGGLIKRKGYAFGGQVNMPGGDSGNPLQNIMMLLHQRQNGAGVGNMPTNPLQNANIFGGRFNDPQNGAGMGFSAPPMQVGVQPPQQMNPLAGRMMGGGRGQLGTQFFAGGGGVTNNKNNYSPNEPGLIDTPIWGDILSGLSDLGTGIGRAASGIDEGISWLQGRDQPFGETQDQQDVLRRLDDEIERRRITNARHHEFLARYNPVGNVQQSATPGSKNKYAKGGRVRAKLEDLLHPSRVISDKAQKNKLPRMRSFEEGGPVFTPRQWEAPSFLERQNYIQKMFGAESNGVDTRVNPRSGAFGRYQLMPNEFNRRAAQLGIKTRISKQDALAGKLPPIDEQDRVFNESFFPEQLKTLRRNDIEPNQLNLYLTHHFDPATAARIAKADAKDPIADLFPARSRNAIITQNKGEPLSGTVGDYRNWLQSRRGFNSTRNPDEILADSDAFGLPITEEAPPLINQAQMDDIVGRATHPEKYFREAIREDQPNDYVRFANPLDGTKGPLYIRRQGDSTRYSRAPRQPNPEEASNELPMNVRDNRVDFPGFSQPESMVGTPPDQPLSPLDFLSGDSSLNKNKHNYLDDMILNQVRGFAGGGPVHSQLDEYGNPVVTLPIKDRVPFVADAGADVPADTSPWMDRFLSGVSRRLRQSPHFGPTAPSAQAQPARSPFSAGPLGLLGSPGERENFYQAPNVSGLTDDLQGVVDDSSIPGSLVDPLEAANDARNAALDDRLRGLMEQSLDRYSVQDKPQNPLFGLFPNANRPLVELGLGILANSGYPNSFGEAVGKAGLGVMKGQEEEALRSTDRANQKLKELINLQYMRSMVENMNPQVKLRLAQEKYRQEAYAKRLEEEARIRRIGIQNNYDEHRDAARIDRTAAAANPFGSVPVPSPDSLATDVD